MWEVAARQSPYHDRPFEWVQEISDAVVHGERPKVPRNVPQEFVRLMTQCWSGNPKGRPTFRDVVFGLEAQLKSNG